MDISALKEKLEELAKRETWLDDEDFCPMDMSGGNYDDAYHAGSKDGETYLARELLKELFGETNLKKD